MSIFKTDALGNNAPIKKSLIETIAASAILSSTDSGTKYLVGTDALVVTLPTTKKGVEFTIINSGADGNNIITISPAAGDAIIGSIANAAADSVSGGVDGKDIINTKATANKGDRITLIGDGASGWYIVEGVGIWASEA
tara:strand:- start:4985 stop:5401 length:417 start_codon:yes stop_codon:yes gene_type:complete